MWRAIFLTLLALGGAACAPGARWDRDRPGATEDDRRRDEMECAAQANRDYSVPAQRIIARSGGRTTEGMGLVTVRDFDSGVFETTVPSASTVGTSTTTGTPLDPQRNRIQPYDAGVFEECMRTRGYERVPPPLGAGSPVRSV